MKKVFSISVILVSAIITTTIHAENLNEIGLHRWAGAYAGGNLGNKWSSFSAPITTGSVLFNDILRGPFVQPNETHPSTVTGGAQLGYNWQSEHIVIGAEANLNGQSLNGSYTVIQRTGPFVGNDNFSAKSNFQTGILGHLGYSMDNWLFYITGGASLAYVEFTANFVPSIQDNISYPALYSTASQTFIGGVGGIGAEYAMSQNWRVGIEGHYTGYISKQYNLGSLASYALDPSGFLYLPVSTNLHFNTTDVLLKVNYQFDTINW
jgi:outer membrane immunogenic protein